MPIGGGAFATRRRTYQALCDGVNTDIEERKRAEEALRHSEALLADAQGLSRTGSVATDVGAASCAGPKRLPAFSIDPEEPSPASI